MRPASSTALAALLACSVAACSLSVRKPPSHYRDGILPDCDASYLPPGIDAAGAAASLATMALDDGYFCPTCPLPYAAAAIFAAAAVWGTLRVRQCRAVEGEHDAFMKLPRDEQEQRIKARRDRGE